MKEKQIVIRIHPIFVVVFITIILIVFNIYKRFLVIKTIYNQPQNTVTNNLVLDSTKSYTVNAILKYDSIMTYNIGNNFSITVIIGNPDNGKVNYSFCIKESNYRYENTVELNDETKSIPLTFYKIEDYYAYIKTEKYSHNKANISIYYSNGDYYKDLNYIGNTDISEVLQFIINNL